MSRTILTAAALCLVACNLDLDAAAQAYFEASESGSTGAPEEDDSTTTDAGPIETVTTAVPTGDESTGDDVEPGGPEILSFTASPDDVPEAGPVHVTVKHTPDVVEVLLFDDYEGETVHLASLAPGEPWTFAVTSEADFEGTHELHAIVVDEEGRWDEETTTVIVDLPPAGSPIWVNEGQDDGDASFKFGVAAAAVEGGVIVAGRDFTVGAGYSFVRRYAGDSGSIEWEYQTAEEITINDLEVMADGEIVVVGSIAGNGTTRAWVHTLGVDGAPVWNDAEVWLDSSEATAVAIAANGDLYVAGELTVDDGIEHTDVFVWHLPRQAMPTWATWGSDETAIPNDYASALFISGEERIFVGGSATLKIPNVEDRRRMSVLEYSNATLVSRWTDRVEDGSQSALLGVASVGDDIAVAGWRRFVDDPYSLEIRRLRDGDDGAPFETLWAHTNVGSHDRLAMDLHETPNGRLVATCTITETSDTLATLVLEGDGQLLWSASYQHYPGGSASASAGAVDSFGYSYFVGTLAIDGGFRVLVGKRHP